MEQASSGSLKRSLRDMHWKREIQTLRVRVAVLSSVFNIGQVFLTRHVHEISEIPCETALNPIALDVDER